MSVKPSARRRSSATYCGAIQMTRELLRRTEVVSSDPSAASAGGRRARAAAPASDRVARKRRRVRVIGTPPWLRSRLQLAFELVQKPPVGAVGDDALGVTLDHAEFVQPQRVKTHAVLGIVFAPLAVRVL